jgi:hypothetical protein
LHLWSSLQEKAEKYEAGSSGYDFATDTLFTEANKWINGIVKMATQSQGLSEEDADVRSERVAVALGFSNGAVFSSYEDDAPKSGTDLESVFFEDLQRSWERLLARRAKARA